MKRHMVLVLAMGLSGCGDFVDEDGKTSIGQVAQGLQSLGQKVADMGEALERDADVEAVPWSRLSEALPEKVGDARRHKTDGESARDRNGAGMSIATAEYEVVGPDVFVGVADLGALRSGVRLALRWVAPLFTGQALDGDIEEIEVEGYPAIRIRDDDGDVLIALLAEGRFAVVAGAEGRGSEDLLWQALDDVDYRRLRGWVEHGRD